MPKTWRHALSDWGHGLKDGWESFKRKAGAWRLRRRSGESSLEEKASGEGLAALRRRGGLERLLWRGGPRFEVEERPEEVVVRARMPGLKRNEFSLEIEDRFLTIRAEQSAEKEERGKGYYVHSSAYGAFSRTVPLPCEVKASEAKAKYRRGELTVRLPRAGESSARRIEIGS